jgi:hypothetical protein
MLGIDVSDVAALELECMASSVRRCRCQFILTEFLAPSPRLLKPNLLLVKMKEKKLLKMQSLPKVLRSQAMRSTLQHTLKMRSRGLHMKDHVGSTCCGPNL